MARLVADFFADSPVTAVVSSPLLRTRQTAEPIASAHGLSSQIDERLIEGTNVFEGSRVTAKRLLGTPSLWPHLRNPLRPSWGEPYRQIATRMRDAMDSAWQSVESGEVVLVSHQLPIWLVHLSAATKPFAHMPSSRRCSLASVTSFARDEAEWREVSYDQPAAALLTGAVDLGAV